MCRFVSAAVVLMEANQNALSKTASALVSIRVFVRHMVGLGHVKYSNVLERQVVVDSALATAEE